MELSPPYRERYRDLERLGGGAQAAVFGATDSVRSAPVALKLLHRCDDAAARERLRREARALASVVHPHLVRFLDLHLDHAPPLLVMERVDGACLADRVEGSGASEEAWARSVGRDLASALAALHAKGITHRDVKLENVILDEARGPVLVDLGLVALEDASSLTEEGAVVGTPAYLAPEVLATQRSGPEADVYALGVLLFATLEGRLPFTMLEQMAAVRTGALPAGPAERLTAAFGPVAGACLAPRAADRPSASNLEQALDLAPDATQEHLLPVAVPASASEGGPVPGASVPEGRAPSRGSPLGRALLAAGLLGLVALGALLGPTEPEPPPGEPPPPEPAPGAWRDAAAVRRLLEDFAPLVRGHTDADGELDLERFHGTWREHLRESSRIFMDPRFPLLVRRYLRSLPLALAAIEHARAREGLAARVEEQVLALEHVLLDLDYWEPFKGGLLGVAGAAEEVTAQNRLKEELRELVGGLSEPGGTWAARIDAGDEHLRAIRARLAVVVRLPEAAEALAELRARAAHQGDPAARARLVGALLVGLRTAWKRGDLPLERRVELLVAAEELLRTSPPEIPEERAQDLRLLALAAELRLVSFGPGAELDGALGRVDALLDSLASSSASPGPVAGAHLADMLAIFEGHHAEKFPRRHPAQARVARIRSTLARVGASRRGGAPEVDGG